ncbi:DNA helicase II [Paraferrimonas haliotis]|uniref:DNA helicase II n=1 Tax=Paraferrimonas haliotis TaxID=2013866 RepID=UPI000BA8FB87|nr:DNA helicase II [Paraferrimonas haliotis]
MDVSHLLEGLNEHQRQAVSAEQSSMLVLAGAGSGKTRVLVHRIAWLLQVEQQSPYSILAVTFTNKAAKEMLSRVEQVAGYISGRMWIGTFHGLAHRLLRAHYQEAKLPQSFQILDSEDQHRMIKRIMKSINLDDKRWPPRQAQSYINAKKDEGLRVQHIDAGYHPMEKQWLTIYQLYQDACDRAGLVDFAELLLRAHELLLNNPTLLAHYQQRFGNILVDEFQDTNAIQYAWIRLLAGDKSHVMIVGDDDQSIYGWRGARIENLSKFLKDFNNAKTIRLEQNYRSTGNILNAANQLIAHNPDRMGKNLWTEGKDGELIGLYSAFNELDEARFIVGRINDWQNQGGLLKECAILYRGNAQSRVLEEALLQQRLSYRIYGGVRFFERQEIKDAMGYLRLIANRDDDAAFERVVNTPARGIGDRTLNIVRSTAREQNVTLWQSCKKLIENNGLTGRARSAVAGFIALVQELEQDCLDMSLHKRVDHCIIESGLKQMYRQEKGEKAEARIENLEELVTAARSFEPDETQENLSEMDAFLAHAALEAGEGQADAHEDAVQLMTLHSAKGLEFPLVFLAGVEEGLFPNQRAIDEGDRLDEERRLCYVGMTRAMEKLYISHAEQRRLYGRENYSAPSRFIREIPRQFVDEIRLKTQVSAPVTSSPIANRFHQTEQNFQATGLSLGQRVSHPKFGAGVVVNYEGSGPQTRVQVNFDGAGSKWLVVAYARLQPL